MLLQLPQDIAICVLTEWLVVDLEEISKLDVAICNSSMRADSWLPLLPLLRLSESHLPLSICCLLPWLHSRNVRVEKVVAPMSAMAQLEGIFDTVVSVPFAFPATTCITFDPQDNGADNPAGIKEFLSLFPNLSVLQFKFCQIYDSQLLELLELPLPHLKVLSLNHCGMITSSAIATVVRHVGSSLQELFCDLLTNASMRKLAQYCSKLTRIGWVMDLQMDISQILKFCACNPALVFIRFNAVGIEWTERMTDMVQQMATLCPHLQELIFTTNDLLSLYVISTCAAYCADIQIIEVCGAVVCFHETADTEDGRFCNVGWTKDDDERDDVLIRRVLVVLENLDGLPIREFGVESNHILVDPEILCLLADSNGNNLRSVWLKMDVNVSRKHVLYLLEKCPHLTCLRMSALPYGCWLNDIFDDALLRRLPKLCPNLVFLELHRCAEFATNAGMLACLEGFRGNREFLWGRQSH